MYEATGGDKGGTTGKLTHMDVSLMYQYTDQKVINTCPVWF